jgi:hypothetical protein
MIYEISEDLHNQINDEFSGLNISCEIDDKYIINENGLDRIISGGVLIDQFFMNNFGENAKSYLSEFSVYPYRVYEYVNETIKDFPIENVDFKIHLRSDLAAVKCNRVFHQNGKPDHVEYKVEGILLARRRWEFTVNPDTGFPEDVKEFLGYYRENGDLGEYFLIKHNVYDLLSDADEIMTQLERPRKNIIKQLKGLVFKNISVADPALSHENKLMQTGEFFRDYLSVINMFTEIGIAQGDNPSDEYMVNKIIRDMNPDENGILKYPFLNHPFFLNPRIPLYQVIIAKISY